MTQRRLMQRRGMMHRLPKWWAHHTAMQQQVMQRQQQHSHRETTSLRTFPTPAEATAAAAGKLSPRNPA
jgi:hypothetical protein